MAVTTEINAVEGEWSTAASGPLQVNIDSLSGKPFEYFFNDEEPDPADQGHPWDPIRHGPLIVGVEDGVDLYIMSRHRDETFKITTADL